MGEAISPSVRTLLNVLSELPGGADEVERDFLTHASRPLPVVTVIGAYDSGKSSLVKRALVDDGREIPKWLIVSARRETFEARECEVFGCVVRDTPGISAGSAEHEQIVRDAIVLSDVIVVTLPPQLLTSERETIVAILSGRFFTRAGITFPTCGLQVVVSRMDEAGVDPTEDSEGYKILTERKLQELRSALERAGVDPSTVQTRTVCADPFQRTATLARPTRSHYDENRSWDGVAGFEDALRALPSRLPALRAAALERYCAIVAAEARAALDGELERQQLALSACKNELERLSLVGQQLDAASVSARASLDGVVEEEIHSASRMHGLSEGDVIRETERALHEGLERWRDQNDAAIRKIAHEAGGEFAVRRTSAGGRSLDGVLGVGNERESAPKGSALAGGLLRFGPRLAHAVRGLHEVALGMSLGDARKELARISTYESFEEYAVAMGKRRLVRDAAQAESLEVAVRFHGTIAALAPILVEVGALYAQHLQERRVAADQARRLEALRSKLTEAARAIAAEEWLEWEERVSTILSILAEQRDLRTRLHDQLAAVVARLERVQGKLATYIDEGATRAIYAGSEPMPSAVARDSRPVNFLLVTALEEEREALLSKLQGNRKLDRDASGAHTYYEAQIATVREDGARYRVVVTSLSGMGPIRAAMKASAVIQRWDPQYVLMVGIAGGVAGQVALGDVMVAEQVADYTLGKVRDGQTREERWVSHPADANLLDAVRNFPTKWEDLVAHERPAAGMPTRRIGVIASGGDVIASKLQIATYLADWPKLIGVDMEGGGMAEGLHGDIKRPRFLMIRGVSDLADADDNTEMKKVWRSYACHIAAAYTVGLLRSGPVTSHT